VVSKVWWIFFPKFGNFFLQIYNLKKNFKSSFFQFFCWHSVKICQKEKNCDFLSRCAGKIISYWCISHESSIISMHRKLLFFPILWCSHTSDHPQEELAKFGYSLLERKVENFQNPSIFWRPAGTYCLNRVTLDKSIPQNMAILAPFFSQKFLCMSCPGFLFFPPSGKNLPPKKKTTGPGVFINV